MKKFTRTQIQKDFKDRDISQAVFAEAIGIGQSHFSHVLAGDRTSQYVIDCLSNFYGEVIEIIPTGQAKISRPSQKPFQAKPQAQRDCGGPGKWLVFQK